MRREHLLTSASTCASPDARPPRLRRWEASAYLENVHGLRVAPATLAKLASIGGGPGFHKDHRVPLYSVEELDRWAKERLGPLLRQHQRCAEPLNVSIARPFDPWRCPPPQPEFDIRRLDPESETVADARNELEFRAD